MAYLLDVHTLFFIGAINACICAPMLFFLRRLHLPSRAGLLWASATVLMLGCAMALIAARGRLPDAASILLANTLATIGSLGIYQSYRVLCMHPPRQLLFWVVAAGVVGAHLALGAGGEHHGARIVLACAAQAGATLLAVPLLRKRRGLDAPAPVKWSIGMMCVLALVNIVRMAELVLDDFGVGADGALTGSPAQALTFAVYSLGPMAFVLSFAGIVSYRVAGDLRRQATTDSLTGLLTRRAFHDRATRMLSGRDGRADGIALMMLDVDHFKSINDRFGHDGGDRALRQLAGMLAKALPAHAIIGRHGGEEFCVMFRCDDAKPAWELADAVCGRVRAETLVDGEHRIRLSVSIGVATAPMDGSRLAELLAVADRRAYFAKDAGRDCVIASDEAYALVRSARAQHDFVPV